jgi:hypothetical protein
MASFNVGCISITCMKLNCMKITCSPRMGLIVAAAIFLHHNATAIPTVNLGTASNFAILGASQITDVPGSSTIVRGDVGLSPTTGAAIGLTAGQLLNGTIYAVDAAGPLNSIMNPGLLTTAQNDLTAAYIDAFNRPVTFDYTASGSQLGGLTLFPGVYRFGHNASGNLIGTLTLDANGDPNPVWIFQATSDLITAAGAPGAPGSRVALINGATSCDVFWQVGSSATIGTYSDFAGNIMAYASVGLDTGATLDGSALAENAAVTLDHNRITRQDCNANGPGVPDSGSTLVLVSFGLASLLAFGRRFFSPA